MNAEYSKYVNPQWVSMLTLLQMNVRCQRCYGAELLTEDGNVTLDFSSGYCVHDTEHNHSAIIDAIKDELDRGRLAVLLSHVLDLDGQPAHRLFYGLTCGALSIMGDVSGSVEAINGEDLCLAFQQSIPLSAAMRAGNLTRYEVEHARIDAAEPKLFANLLDAHVRLLNLTLLPATAATLDWEIATA